MPPVGCNPFSEIAALSEPPYLPLEHGCLPDMQGFTALSTCCESPHSQFADPGRIKYNCCHLFAGREALTGDVSS
jgi:hypothetical protein